MLTVVKKFEFEAAHHLPRYSGPCNRIHGHSYKLEVGVTGPISADSGMIVDFKELKQVVKEQIIDYLDHYYLNEVRENLFPCGCPTAERMVIWMVEILKAALLEFDETLDLVLVRLYETSGSYAEWQP